jgi:hypothetical protein
LLPVAFCVSSFSSSFLLLVRLLLVFDDDDDADRFATDRRTESPRREPQNTTAGAATAAAVATALAPLAPEEVEVVVKGSLFVGDDASLFRKIWGSEVKEEQGPFDLAMRFKEIVAKPPPKPLKGEGALKK